MSEWISVKDSLPKKSDHKKTVSVLLWCANQPSMPFVIGYGILIDGVNFPYKIKCWKSLDSGCNIIYGSVTHWMPLPEPPKE